MIYRNKTLSRENIQSCHPVQAGKYAIKKSSEDIQSVNKVQGE